LIPVKDWIEDIPTANLYVTCIFTKLIDHCMVHIFYLICFSIELKVYIGVGVFLMVYLLQLFSLGQFSLFGEEV
jgi:hypothetical protein